MDSLPEVLHHCKATSNRIVQKWPGWETVGVSPAFLLVKAKKFVSCPELEGGVHVTAHLLCKFPVFGLCAFFFFWGGGLKKIEPIQEEGGEENLVMRFVFDVFALFYWVAKWQAWKKIPGKGFLVTRMLAAVL